MGANDTLEMLEAAQAECARLEQVNRQLITEQIADGELIKRLRAEAERSTR